jgi:uncharacterized membrane protein YqjE
VANSASVVELMDDYFRRLLRLVSVLVDMHMDIAIQEANYEKRRLIGGFVMLGIGIGLFTLGGILLQVLGVFVVSECLSGGARIDFRTVSSRQQNQ